MPAYLLLLVALLSRIVPHPSWFGFTAVGGSLIYFGATRSKHLWREMLVPIVAFAALDYYLTTHVYSYDFRLSDYLVTWVWYAAAMLLGRILLATRVSVLRVASAALLGPTSFFLVSNYSVWVAASHPGGMYAPTFAGLLACLTAGLPFYGRGLASTGLVLALAFGIPALLRRNALDRQSAFTHQNL